MASVLPLLPSMARAYSGWQIQHRLLQVLHQMPRLRLSRYENCASQATGNLLAGWGRIGLHVWDTSNGSLLWSFPLTQRAVSAHYSLDVVLKDDPGEAQEIWMALPLLREDPRAPRALGVRGTDIVKHVIGTPADVSERTSCVCGRRY